jgi:VWFA-related protein
MQLARSKEGTDMTAKYVIALLAAACIALPAEAQSGREPTNPISVLHVDSKEVSLDLVVHDRKKKSVVDLKPEEIQVTDNGAPVTLTNFRLVRDGSSGDHLITLVFDRLEPNMLISARSVAAKVLKVIPEKGFSLAVLQVGGRLRLGQGFSSDRKALDRAVMAITNPATSAPASPFDLPEKDLLAEVRNGSDSTGKGISAQERTLAQTLLSALQESGQIVQYQHAPLSLSGLLALVHSQQELAQRKAIIYFTSGAPMDSRAKEMLESITGAANRSSVSIYAVDLNALAHSTHEESAANIALIGNIPGTVQQATSRQTLPPPSQVFTDDIREVMGDDNSPTRHLAQSTGGAYIGGEDSLRKPLEQMIQDMTTYYEASYVPPVKEYDGKFRSIGVKPLRAGVNILASKGYFALPPQSGASTRPFELPLLQILGATELPTDLAFHAAVLRFGGLPNKDANTLAIEAPLSDVEIRTDDSTKLYSAHLSVIAQVKDKSGTVLQHFSEDIPRRGALEELESARSETVTALLHFTAPPGEYVLEAAVLDCNSGKAGAKRVAFNIPKPSDGPSLSDLVLVRHMEPIDAKSDPLEPLLYGDDRATPNLSGHATRDLKRISVFFVSHLDPSATEASALDIQMFRNGEALNHMASTGGAGVATHLATFAVGSLPDGLYEVKTTLTQGGKKAESVVSFTIAGDRPDRGKTEAADLSAPAIESHAAGELAITLPSRSAQAPAPAEVASMLADTTARAITYDAALPNFICVEVTSRSVDSSGSGRWARRDRMAELLTFRDGAEQRSMLEMNGQKTKNERADMKGWLSHGEFGAMLKMVFAPSSKADFHWSGTAALRDGAVQVFDYRVAREHSGFYLSGSGVQATVGFHGQIFVDSATRDVRRITAIADDVPRTLPIFAASMRVDYDYIAINNHDYLLPIGGQVSLRQGRQAILNEIEFRNYRRFGSTVKMVEYTPPEMP